MKDSMGNGSHAFCSGKDKWWFAIEFDKYVHMGVCWTVENTLWSLFFLTLCSPHGRKIIPHFIHLNNVK